MMLSKRITAKSLELNPASQARKSIVNDNRDCHPAGCVSPPERPPLPPPPPPAALARLLPSIELPALADALCLPSEAEWCSTMFSVFCARRVFRRAPCLALPPLLSPRRVIFLTTYSLPLSSPTIRRHRSLLAALAYEDCDHIPEMLALSTDITLRMNRG